MQKIMADEYKQQSGYVINDPQYGTISIGKDNEVKRPRQVQISSASLAALKLFDDGGFELRSTNGGENSKGDAIVSNSKDGFSITSTGKGIFIDANKGSLTIRAKDIVLLADGDDSEGISIFSHNHIKLDAADNISIEGSQVAIGARYKMMIGTAGPLFMRGKGGVTITEPSSKLIPTSVSDVADKILQFVFPEYF